MVRLGWPSFHHDGRRSQRRRRGYFRKPLDDDDGAQQQLEQQLLVNSQESAESQQSQQVNSNRWSSTPAVPLGQHTQEDRMEMVSRDPVMRKLREQASLNHSNAAAYYGGEESD